MNLLFTRNLCFLAICLLTFPFLTNAQIQIPNTPQAQRYKDLIVANVPTVQMPAIDLAELQREDAEDEAAGLPPRFGKRFNVDLNLDNSGRWDNLPNGGRIWRLAIESQDAISLNMAYSDFFMPKGAQMFIFTEDFTQILGAFSAANNKPDGKFATNLIFNQKVIIGYYEPRAVRGQGRIAIDGIVHGYRSIPVPEFDKTRFNAFRTTTDCLVDVACPEGQSWEDQIKSVAVVVVSGGTRFCTGALVANTTGNQQLLFLTANNCLYDPFLNNGTQYDAINNPSVSNWIFEWNYQKDVCNGSVPAMLNSTTGANVIANTSATAPQIDGSDFALLELIESPIDQGYDVFFSGWDAGANVPQSGVAIHHPNGRPKKIAIENGALVASTSNPITGGSSTDLTHWEVPDWDAGALEGSSQGAPFFDGASGRIVGQFSGGFATCDLNTNQDDGSPDYLGQFAYSWLNNGATDARRRLKDWLDPNNTGQTALDGYYGVNSCSTPEIVFCDSMFVGDNADGQSIIDSYGGATALGKEYIHSFTPNTSGLTSIQLMGLSADLDLFLLSDCNANTVIESSTNLGTNQESIMADLMAGTTYYLIIDAKGAATESAYTLWIGCMDPCDSPTTLNCGDQFNGTTSGLKNYYSQHGASGTGWTGGESVFEFTTTGGQVTIDLMVNVDLDLFLLDDCDPVNNEIARSTNGSTNDEMITANLAAGTYYIMVDGFSGSAGSYTLNLACPVGGDCTNPFGLVGDQLYNGNTNQGANNFEQHGQNTGYIGNEIVYEYTPNESGPFVITLSNLSVDVDLFLLGASCDPINNEIASSTQIGLTNEVINATLTSGVTYYIMIDGETAATTAYNLFVETPTACDLPPNLICADLNGPSFGVSGSTIGTDNDYLLHGGQIQEYRGGEVVYEFISDGGNVIIELTNLADDLDVFLLSVCDSVQNEVARSDNSGLMDELISTTVAAGTYYIMVDGVEDAESNFALSLKCNRPPILVRLKVSMQGAYDTNTNLMTDNFRMQLSTTEPFTGLGFTHTGDGGGETFDPMILVTTGNDAIMDWAFIELRLASAPQLPPIATRAALVQRDGDLVDMDGTSPVEFGNIPDDYYIAVKMRNHLGVMTDLPVFVGFE
ncbi:MAG: PPC domain-containing protein [Bacteroidota bacterium]